MEFMMNTVQSGRGGRRRWSDEQNLAVLQEWKAGVPLEEACRHTRCTRLNCTAGSAASIRS